MIQEKNYSSRKIVIYAHNGGGLEGGWDDALLEYLLKKNSKEVIKVDFPFGKRSLFSTVRVTKYDNGTKTVSKESYIKLSQPELLSYAKDFFYGLFYGLKYARNTDLFVGMDNLLAFVGLLLKRLGLVKKVAYVVVDYTPIRFSNTIINELYYSLDRLVAYSSDIVWPLSSKMLEGRESAGVLDLSKVTWQEAPFGNNSDKNSPDQYFKNKKRQIVYFGGILKSKGAELFVPIAQSLLAKGFTDFKLLCIGGGDVEYLKSEVTKNGLSEFIEITGRVDKSSDVENLLFESSVAIAPYYPDDPNSFSYYADPGKVKVYLGCGLPVVITKVPPVAVLLDDKKAGLLSEYDADAFADNIIKLLSNEQIYGEYRRNAIDLGKSYSWDTLFSNIMDDII